MIYYSHRGNLEGSNPQRENSPEYIDEAIQAGFSVEVDVHVIGESIFLGHDFPQYQIDRSYLDNRKYDLLLHAKNFLAAKMLATTDLHYFFHSTDKYTLTSKGLIWVHDLSLDVDDISYIQSRCVVPLITLELIKAFNKKTIFGICSDFIAIAR